MINNSKQENTATAESRIQNSVKNISYGIIITVLTTLLSFISRTVFIKTLGAINLSLNGLFTEVISMMSLAELGIGMAIIYNLYKPIADKNYTKISQLMTLYKNAYNLIAIFTIFIGFLIVPFIKYLITDVNFSSMYINIVFILFFTRTACSYIYSYKTALLNADQKQYIVSLVNFFVQLLTTIIAIIILYLTKNFILYLCLMIFSTLLSNILISFYVDKNYSNINYNSKMEKSEKKKIFSNIKNIFIKRVSGQITTSTDNILISTLVSTIQVGLYSNYNMLFSVVRTLKSQLTRGLTASIGNLSVTENIEKNITILEQLTFMFFSFSIVMCAGLMTLSSQFISIWLGPKYIMADTIIFVALINLFIEICCEPLWQYLEVSGLFKQDRNIAILGSSINLIISIVLGIYIGIVGIFIGTICSQTIQLILKTHLLFKYKFSKKSTTYFLLLGKMAIAYALLFMVISFICHKTFFDNIFIEFLAKGIFSIIISTGIILLLFFKTKEFRYTIEFIKSVFDKIIMRRKLNV